MRQHDINLHTYTDETQIYPTMKPEETSQLSGQQTFLIDIKTWKTVNLHLLKSDKTEGMTSGSKTRL